VSKVTTATPLDYRLCCGATAAANHWINKDLLPGVKVNTNAMVRVTQLEQDGYTLIYE
jgi:hypothetical protein